MKTLPLFITLALGAATLHAADSQIIDLGNGSTIEVKDGKVSVKSSTTSDGSTSGGSGKTSSFSSTASSSTSSRTDSDGNTVTTVTSERDGKTVTRTVKVSKDGTVTVTDPEGNEVSPSSEKSPAAEPSGGWLGVHTVSISEPLRAQVNIPDGQGILVEFVAPAGPAANAGILANDIILTLDGQPVESVESFRAKLGQTKPGQQVKLDYLRKGKTSTATVTLAARPPETAGPDDDVTGEAERLLEEMKQKGKPGRRGIVVDGKGNTRVIEGDGADAFDLLLNDPNIPETMKEEIRKSRDMMKKMKPDAPKDGE